MSTFYITAGGTVSVPASGGGPARVDFLLTADAVVSGMTIRMGNITHTYLPDVDALLVAPNGINNLLFMSDIGDGTDLSNYTLDFYDSAPGPAPSGPLPGGFADYRPTNIDGSETDAQFGTSTGGIRSSLTGDTFASAFANLNARGTWSMYLSDDLPADSDVGTMYPQITFTTVGTTATIYGTTSDDYFSIIYHISGGGNYLLNNTSVGFGSLNAPTINLGDGNDRAVDDNDVQTFLLGTGDDLMETDGTIRGDVYDGGAGNDTIDVGDMFGALIVDLQAGTISLDGAVEQIRGFENIIGTDFDQQEILIGNDLANLIEGLAGNDSIRGGGGNDFLDGGAGHDNLNGEGGFDILNGGDGDDGLRASAGGDVYNGGSGLDTVIFDFSNAIRLYLDNPALNTGDAAGATFFSIEHFNGSFFADIMSGDGASNVFFGWYGADSLYGRAGADKLFGGVGADNLYGGFGPDALDGGGIDPDDPFGTNPIDLARYDDAIYGNLTISLDNPTHNVGAAAVGDTYIGIEGVVGGVGNDTIVGNSFENTLYGLSGNDNLNGLGGADTMVGGPGDDICNVDNAADRVIEIAGGGTVDQVLTTVDYTLAAGQQIEALLARIPTGTANIQLIGNELAQNLVGNAGANRLYGGGGGDTLSGLAGIDTLDGQGGHDRLIGGADADRFVFRQAGLSAANSDLITDFSAQDEIWFDTATGTGAAINPTHS